MDDKIIAPLLPLNLHQQTGIFSLASALCYWLSHL
jgi:hypothetical protein